MDNSNFIINDKDQQTKTGDKNIEFNVVIPKTSMDKRKIVIGLCGFLILIIGGIIGFFIGKNNIPNNSDTNSLNADNEAQFDDSGEEDIHDKLNKAISDEEKENIINEEFKDLNDSGFKTDNEDNLERWIDKSDAYVYASLPQKAMDIIEQLSQLDINSLDIKMEICLTGIDVAEYLDSQELGQKYKAQCLELSHSTPEEGYGGA